MLNFDDFQQVAKYIGYMNIQEIWQQYHDRLKAYVFSRVKDDQVAEDILHDVYLKVHKSLSTLKESDRIASWLYRITNNTVLDHYRNQNKSNNIEFDETMSVVPEESTPNKATRDLSSCLVPIINTLPDSYKEAIVLAELEGFTQAEVADRIGLTLSGAKSKIQRGRKRIREILLSCCSVELDRHNRVTDYELIDKSQDCCDN